MKLTCYRVDPITAPIVPGRPERPWMDRTIDKRAYRCLPLTIANTSGWELLAPFPIRATWNGGQNPQDIVVEGPADMPDGAASPVHTYFGDGVLTFHTGWLFRTEPGWDLWVGGPPNHVKHGIFPLTGVVETSWLSAPFTMNWRFTQPGTIGFAPGEPFAFVAPVPHEALDAFDVEAKDIAADPATAAEFESWKRSRAAFARDAKPGEGLGWQRHYFQGQKPDGSPGPADHKSRRRLKAPRDA